MVKNNKIQEIDTFNYHNFKENCVNFINENWNRKLRLRCSNNNATIEMLEKRDMNRRREGWYTPYTWVSKKVFYNGLREEYELLFLEGVKYPHITSRYEIIQPNNPEILEFSNMGIIEILN
jgi:hypothetical protein